MNKLLRIFFVALLGLVGNSVFADEIEIDFSNQGLENAQDVTTMDFRSDDGKIVVSFENGSNTKNGPKYYDTGTAIRCYGGNIFNVKLNLETEIVTKLVFTFGSGDGSNELSVRGDSSEGTFEGDTWTGRANGSIFGEIGGTSGHRRIMKMTFTLSPKDAVTKTFTSIDFSGDYLTRFTPGKDGDETELPTAVVKADDAAVVGAAVKWSLKMGSNWIMGEEEPSIGDGKVYIPNHSCGDLTLTAKYEGNDQYEGSTKSYTLKVYKGYMNTQSILEDFPVVGSDTWATKESEWNKGYLTSYWEVMPQGDGNFLSQQALVTYASGSYTYIKDEFGTLLLYGSGLGFKQGDIISGDFGNDQGFGAIYGTLKTYNGLLELAVNKEDVEFVVKSSDNPVEPKTISLAELNQGNMNEYVRIEYAEFVELNGKNLTFKVGDETLAVYNQFGIKVADDEGKSLLEPGAKYNLEGMGCIYWKNQTLTNQLYLTKFEKRQSTETGIKSLTLTISHDGEVFTESFPASGWQNKVIEGKTSSIKIMKAVVETSKPMKYVGFIATMYNAEDGWQHDENGWRTVDFQKQGDGTWVIDLGEGQELVESEWLNANKTKTFEFFVYAEDEAGTPIHYNNGGQDKNYKVTFSTGGGEDADAIKDVKLTFSMNGQELTQDLPASDWQNLVVDEKINSLKIKRVVVETGKTMKSVGLVAGMFMSEEPVKLSDDAKIDFMNVGDGVWMIDLGEGVEILEPIDGAVSGITLNFVFYICAKDEAGNTFYYNNGGENYKVTITPRDDPNAIENVNANANANTKLYNLSGQPVTRTYRGIVIQNARKVLR
jgi:hypothetical protein